MSKILEDETLTYQKGHHRLPPPFLKPFLSFSFFTSSLGLFPPLSQALLLLSLFKHLFCFPFIALTTKNPKEW